MPVGQKLSNLLPTILFSCTLLSATGCAKSEQPDSFVQTPGGLLIAAEFEARDVDYSQPINFTVFAQNPSDWTIKESVTIALRGMHLANPLVATLYAHESVGDYSVSLELQPGESTAQPFRVDVETYSRIGTGNYNLHFVGAEHFFDHLELSGALAISIVAPETVAVNENLHYQVEIHNPTYTTVTEIKVRELHLHFEEYIPVLRPGESVTVTQIISASKYQNARTTGVTVLTETARHGSDLASKIVRVEG